MTVLLQAGDPGSAGNQNVTQGEFREQLNAINDAIRQLGGMPTINPGDTVVNEPLNTPYVLYVNQDIGEDTFVFRDPYDYSTQAGLPNPDKKDPMRRMSQQRLLAGYTEARPFKSLNRAVIEAAILTSRDYLDCCAALRTRVTIIVSGEILVYNDENPQDACSDYFDTEYVTGPDHLYTPGEATHPNGKIVSELYAFNPADGGLLLPRGVSVVSLDLRKSIVRPHFVPCATKENDKKTNRRAIFKVTGEGYYYGFTFMDALSYASSHHLLDCFQFATKAELDEFYLKIKRKFGSQIPFDDDLIQTNPTEYTIVGPNPDGNPSNQVDTTASASPYVYNCSIRSEFGLSGIFCDGSRAQGFKSFVTAQFTGVSLQTDLNAWEKYEPSGVSKEWWTYVDDYNDLIEQSPDDVRQKEGWRSVHVRAINQAVIQEVSVFCIGQGVHHMVESGGECTITNSNSNFGGVAGLAIGYNPRVAANDGPWEVKKIHRALDPFSKSQSVATIPFAVVSDSMANNGTTLLLADPLDESQAYPGQPDALRKLGYTLKGGDYIWVRNRYGHDYRVKLKNNPWDPKKPAEIQLQGPFKTDSANGNKAPGSEPRLDYPDLKGSQVYIRRFQDTRDKTQRSWWLVVQGCEGVLRTPYRDYVLRDVNDKWPKTYLSAVARTKKDRSECDLVEVVLRNCNDGIDLSTHQNEVYYRRGDTIRRNGKHFVAVEDHMGDFDPKKWNEGYVHMEEDFVPEGQILNTSPVIVFDGDFDELEKTKNCGYSLTTPEVKAQYESATDFKGLLNYTRLSSEVQCDLVPQPIDSQDADVKADEKLNFHRPSNVRMFNHAWEWAGYLNYSKALPKYQQQISPTNKWTYYFTNQNGGKCYVSGFNEEGYQVTAKGLIDLATGDEIAGIDIGTPEEDIDRSEGRYIGPAMTQRDDRKEGEKGEPPYPQGYVLLAQALEANPDISKEDAADVNDAIENPNAGVVKKAWLDEWVKGERFVIAPKQGVAAIVLHVVPSGKAADAIKGEDSVPYGFPNNEDDGTWFDEDIFDKTGRPSTLTEAMEVASRIYVPIGAEIIISVHGNLPNVEKGPLQLVNSYARVVIASARGLQNPATIKLDAKETDSALKRFPQFTANYGFSAGVIFADVHIQANTKGQRACLTFNGGLAMGKQGLKIEVDECASFSLADASFGEQTGFSYYPKNDDDEVKCEIIVNSVDGSKPWLKVFGSLSDPNASTGSGLTGHGVDLTLDFRSAGYGQNDNVRIVHAFRNKTSEQIQLCYLGLGSRGGCRAGGRVGPVVDFDFGGNGEGDWDMEFWISKGWVENQNYFGRHFRCRDTKGDIKGVYNLSNDAYDSMKDVTLIQGSVIDIDGESEWQCGPFGVLREWEKEKGGTRIKCDSDQGAYIYNGKSDRKL